MIENNNNDFKELFRIHKISTDVISRVPRFTTIFQKISDRLDWHTNYSNGDLDLFTKNYKPYMCDKDGIKIQGNDNIKQAILQMFNAILISDEEKYAMKTVFKIMD